MLTASFGSFTFGVNEINDVRASVSSWRTPRGDYGGQVSRIQITGSLKSFTGNDATSKSSLYQKMRNLQSNQNRNGSLVIQADGVNTPHTLSGASASGGVRMENLRWGSEGRYHLGSDLLYTRGFTVVFEAESPASGNPVVSYIERVINLGNGGQRRRLRTSLRGQVRRQILAEETPIRIIQTGRAVGLLDHIDPPSPLLPDSLDNERIEISYETPSAVVNGDERNFGTSWTYHFDVIPPQSILKPGIVP